MNRRILRIGRRLLWSLTALLLLTGGTALWGYQLLRASLPVLEGELPLTGLSAPVRVERDAAGVATIVASDRTDASRALGFVHAQERYFQMDLLRRRAAGELAALFGTPALDYDRQARLHRFRQRAEHTLTRLSEADRLQLDAYSAGVNAGLSALNRWPFEYLLLHQTPDPWQPSDTLLATYAMYLQLQERQIRLENIRGLLWDRLPETVAAFLDPPGTHWDAPLDDTPLELAGLPSAEQFDLRHIAADYARAPGVEHPEQGSNAWAVGGALTEHGGALLANDMHLALAVPNVWYRVVLRYGPEHHRVVGVTLPGAPAVVVGSNGTLAWGFTNNYGDWSDLIELDTPDPHHYRAPEGISHFAKHHESIAIAGAETESLEIRETRWGPVIDEDHRGRPRALRWVAHDPRAVNLALMQLETAADVETGLAIAGRAGIPGLNILLADREGRIAWGLAGPLPDRSPCDTRRPLHWQNADRCWQDWLAPQDYPRLIDPPGQRVWSANARPVGGAALERLGDGGYALGVRAWQIRESLRTLERADEHTLLAIQLEDRSVLLAPWRELLLDLLDTEALHGHSGRAALRRLVAASDPPRAQVDAVGYRLINRFRTEAANRVFGPLNSWLQEYDERFDYAQVRQREGPLWTLVSEQPEHWLTSDYPDWRALLLEAADAVIEPFGADGLDTASWGEVNTLAMRHPLSLVLPVVGRWLDMPADPLPGDAHVPRVQLPRNGASQRLVVAPGREEQGLFHMPGGQSGHPLSSYYRTGHTDWVNGEPSPLLPGPVRYTLYFHPEHDQRADE